MSSGRSNPFYTWRRAGANYRFANKKANNCEQRGSGVSAAVFK